MSGEREADVLEMKFQKSKRYKRVKIVNMTGKRYKVLVDVDNTNTLNVEVLPNENYVES